MKQFTTAFIIIAIFTACNPGPKSQVFIEDTPWGKETFTMPEFTKKAYLITDFGAQNTIGINNQKAIQKAIDECTLNGGGTVIIPEGTWETSYIDLKSGVNLYLSKDAVLSFSDSIELYKTPTFTRWEGIECMNYHPLIYAKDANNVGISGTGKLVGNGEKWWQLARGTQKSSLSKLYDMVEGNVPPEERNCLAFEPTSYLRPAFIQFINCKNLLLDSVEINSGPMWTTHLVYCENVIAQNLQVITDGVNNDGIVPDASKQVLINNCYFSTGDDCIVIKSGLNEDGWRVGKASERIVIKNCRTKHGHGGVVIGSEMSGSVRNIYAYDCDFSNTERGLRVKSMKGRGGIVENLWFKNIRMDSIKKEAIKINMFYGSSSIAPRNDSMPIFRNFNYENIKSTNSQYCVRIIGSPELKVTNMNFKNIDMQGKYGLVIKDAENCIFNSINITSQIDFPLIIENGNNLAFDKLDLTATTDTMALLKGLNMDVVIHNSNAKTYNTPFIEENESNIILQ